MKRQSCRGTRTWRLVSIEVAGRWRTRTLWGASIQEASGPTDDSLTSSRDHADRLVAVGICVPVTPVMSPVDQLLQVVLWHVDPDGTVREVTRPQIVDAEMFDLGEAYYGPPADEGESWAAGRYVFEFAASPVAARAGWRWSSLR